MALDSDTMTKLRKCDECQEYTLQDICPKCKEKSKDAHYKYIKIRDAPPSTTGHFNKRRKEIQNSN
jgi:recombinational DNA repair protein RecR